MDSSITNKPSLLNLLLERGVISSDRIDELRQRTQDENEVAEMAIQRGLISEEDVAKARADVLGVPYIDLFGKTISQTVLNIIPRELAQNYHVVAFEKAGIDVSIAMEDPSDFKAIEAVEFLAREHGFKVKYSIISASGFRYASKQYATLGAEVEEALAGADQSQKTAADEILEGEKTADKVVKSAPVSKMVSVILKHAVEGNASDIHIEPVENETRVRYRVDGVLHTSLVLPRYVHSAIVARIKVLSNLKLDETRIPQDGRFRTEWDGRIIDYRVSTLPLFTNEKVVMRILDRAAVVLDLEKLGFEGRDLKVMQASVEKSVGMILLTGPTGSGKSTTLSALLTILNDESINIVTLEDPVEYYINGVNQSQIRPEVGLTFAAGLRSILRQDPDVIMVGEIRDNETAELAVHAALTGHLVLSTLHTNDSFGAIPRLIDMKIEPFLITASLSTVAAQRLVRRLCPYCQKETTLPAELEKEVRKYLEIIPEAIMVERLGKKPDKLVFHEGKGCVRCEQTGYKGRLLINEILEMDEDLKKVCVTNPTIDEIRNASKRQNMVPMLQDGLLKALEGKTSLAEILRVTKE
ncbi:MAG: GspE/PulE family protein [Patescibacteria group bacterium]|nr:GspE/PulE family protein [Patescibacteria group bacterium]MDD5715433.1 GspE/PulE family protein [Patescibacteria group bacterium]